MRILLALNKDEEALLLRVGLESMDHSVLMCQEVKEAAKFLRDWRPELLITDESLGRKDRHSGTRPADLCSIAAEQEHGSFRTQALILVSTSDWTRVQEARRTGAHVIVKSSNWDAVIRYIQTLVDNLTTDRMLGPILSSAHRLRMGIPVRFCATCEWIGASVGYLSSQADIPLPPVRSAVLNCLLFFRRGQSAPAMANLIAHHRFLRSLLKGRTLRESAIKMEISRLRDDITSALERIGAPYTGDHFLPKVHHGYERYRLTGNWQLSHIPRSDPGTPAGPYLPAVHPQFK